MPRPFDWTYDEAVLAGDLLARNEWRQIAINNPDLIALSERLRSLAIHPREGRPDSFRSPGSVRRKLGDIGSQRPGFQGKVTRGGPHDAKVAHAFHSNAGAMHDLAVKILNSAPGADGPGSDGRLSRADIGAWVLKSNPDVWDLQRFLDSGLRAFDGTWTVQPNYRSQMMRTGDRVLFWVTNSKAKVIPRGFLGIGLLRGEPRGITPSSDPGLWLDDSVQANERLEAPVLISFFDHPVTQQDLIAAGIDDLEIQRAPQTGNPSFVTPEKLRQIEALSEKSADSDRPITTGDHGAGFGTAVQNRVIELAAMRAVTDYYVREGWTADDVSHKKCGWDITCRAPDGRTHHVEVKGTSGRKHQVLITANELSSAKSNRSWVLAVVPEALTADPKVVIYPADQVVRRAQALVYRVDLTAKPTSGTETAT